MKNRYWASALALVLLALPQALAEDAKVFIKSDPAGAEIILNLTEDGKVVQKTIGKTAALVTIPAGRQTLTLILKGYKVGVLDVDVKAGAINKPDPVKLEQETVKVDVLFAEEGWQVFIDKKPVNDINARSAVVPCTISLPKGTYNIALIKNGYKDISQKVNIDNDTTVEMKGAVVVEQKIPWKDAALVAFYVGNWKMSRYGPLTISFKDNVFQAKFPSGTYSTSALIIDNTLFFKLSSFEILSVSMNGKDGNVTVSAYTGKGIDFSTEGLKGMSSKLWSQLGGK